MDVLLQNIDQLYQRKTNLNLLINQLSSRKTIKNDPIMIHIVGQESRQQLQGSYICTTLRQIETAQKLGIKDDKIFIIYSKETMLSPNLPCNFTQSKVASRHLNKELPSNIHIDYVDNTNKFDDILKKILINECTDDTPILFGYDGHGFTDFGNNNGNMTIYDQQKITDQNLIEIFKTTNRIKNHKIFLWTQCGSYDFVLRIKDHILGYHIASTKEPNTCGLGSGVMREFSCKMLNLGFGSEYEGKCYPISDLSKLTFKNYNSSPSFATFLTDPNIKPEMEIYKYLNINLSSVNK